MWKLHRYYLKELAVNAAITFLVMFAVVTVSLIARAIQKSVGGDPMDAVKYIFFWALDSFSHLLTISLLIGTVVTFARAAADRELVAIRAAGLSPRVPMTAAVLLGLLLSVVGSFANHYLIPEVHFQKYRVLAGVMRNVVTNLRLGSDRISIPGSDIVLTFVQRDARGDYLDCTVYGMPERADERFRSPIWKVDRVSIPIADDSEQIVVNLFGVRDPIWVSEARDLQFAWDIRALADHDRRQDRDDDLRSDQLLAEVLREVHPRPFEAIYTLFRRCCFSLMPLLLAPIGFCIAELTRERGRVMALLVALVPLSTYYLGEMVGARLLRATDNPWTAWTPAVLLLLFGLPLCWRQLRR